VGAGVGAVGAAIATALWAKEQRDCDEPLLS